MGTELSEVVCCAGNTLGVSKLIVVPRVQSQGQCNNRRQSKGQCHDLRRAPCHIETNNRISVQKRFVKNSRWCTDDLAKGVTHVHIREHEELMARTGWGSDPNWQNSTGQSKVGRK
jgi:hypothetical protein